MLELVFFEAALRFLEALAKSDATRAGQIRRRIEAALEHPDHYLRGPLKGQTHNDAPVFKIRSGDYRVLAQRDGNRLLVLWIGHRREVYEQFSRK